MQQIKHKIKKAVILLSTFIIGASYAEAFSGGDGTIESPYQLSNINDLEKLSALVMTDESVENSATKDKCFKMTNDIDMTSVEDFLPIGGWSDVETNNNLRRFAGSFDGDGFIIRDLVINKTEKNYVALFGLITSTAKIENLGLECKISGGSLVAGLVGGIGDHKDLAVIDYVSIPKGTFRMGDTKTTPQHTVNLSAFKMSKYEITNSQFCIFLNANKIGSSGI